MTSDSGPIRVMRAEDQSEQWDAFARTTAGSSFAHRAGWNRVITGVLGHEYIGFAALDAAGEWQGILPLVRVRTPGIGHSLISVLCLNYGGPLGRPDAQAALVDAAFSEARRSGATRVQLRSRAATPGAQPSSERKVLVVLDLPATPEALMASFPSKLRSQIRRPAKEGMEFRTGPAEMESFYRVFARNMRDLGTPVYSRRFFTAAADAFPDVVFGAVYWRGHAVGAGCGFVWNGEFEITWASTIREYNRLSPNMLLYWGFMEAMIARGVTAFNFGRSTRDAGTHRFKMQWGGREEPLGWLEWTAESGTADDGQPSRAARAAAAVWRHLPMPVANVAGPIVARRLPWW